MQSLPNEPFWVPTQVIVDINIANVSETGECHALLFPDKLEGAVARPQNRWAYNSEADAVELSVAYMEGIAQAHAFEQGNKRTGFDAGFIFLKINGYDLTRDADNELMAIRFLELLDRSSPFHCTTEEFEAYLSDYVTANYEVS